MRLPGLRFSAPQGNYVRYDRFFGIMRSRVLSFQ